MIIIILLTGVMAGVLSGLLGIGGGVIIVPVLTTLYESQALFNADQIMHLAVGTSLASMIFTTAGGLASHLRYGHYKGITPSLFWGLIPGLWIGAWSGNFLNSLASPQLLKIIFMIVAMFIALRMILSPHLFFHHGPQKQFSPWVFLLIGLVIGSLSSLIGIGGGIFLVPILAYMGMPPYQVSAATSIGTFCSVCMGTIGSVYFGWGSIPGQEWVTGYVYWPWAVLIGMAGMILAPTGVWLSRKLPVSIIRKLFALILVAIAVRMAFNL
jgi:uncharacterized membrane protein YfcA